MTAGVFYCLGEVGVFLTSVHGLAPGFTVYLKHVVLYRFGLWVFFPFGFAEVVGRRLPCQLYGCYKFGFLWSLWDGDYCPL